MKALLFALVLSPAFADDPKPDDDPAALKATIAALQKEVADLKLKLSLGELEKVGAKVSTEKPKEGPEFTTVNILRGWLGDKESLDKLKELPNVQTVYVDSEQFNDEAVAALKDVPSLTSLTLMSSQVTDASLESVKAMPNLNMLFLTGSKITDPGLAQLKDLGNLKVLSLSKTDVTDAGLENLKECKALKSLYVIGSKVTDDGIKKLKESLPEIAVYK